MPSTAPPADPGAKTALTNPTGFYNFPLGELRLIALSEGYCGTLPASAGPPPIAADQDPADVWALLAANGAGAGAAGVTLTALAVVSASGVALIDTGFGAYATPDGENRPGMVAQNLAAAGIGPEEVDLVVISHPHGDHIGGVLRPRGELAFPNARYVLPRQEWEFWTAPDPDLSTAKISDGFRQGMLYQARTALPQIEHALDLVEPGEELAPGMRFVALPGHTYGMCGVEVVSGEERLLYVADAFMHAVISIKRPDWRIAMDLDHDAARRTRRDLLDRCSGSGELVLAPHFAWPALGRIIDRGDEHQWVAADWRWWPED
jgi:glyoxylase-like metal-dependent hydrolase (beta-lactamase superfamily II)